MISLLGGSNLYKFFGHSVLSLKLVTKDRNMILATKVKPNKIQT